MSIVALKRLSQEKYFSKVSSGNFSLNGNVHKHSYQGNVNLIESKEKICCNNHSNAIKNTTLSTSSYHAKILKCNPCSVLVDNNKSGLIYNKILNDDLEILLKDLNKNILSSTELELSQLLLVRIFIQNEMFLNANYYIDKFKDNLLLSEYLRSGKL